MIPSETRRNLTYYFSMMVLLVAIVLMVLFGYVLFYPFNPLDVVDPVPVTSKTVIAGEKVYYAITYCKHTDKPSVIQRYLMNGSDVQLDSMLVNRPVGCQTSNLSIKIPTDTPPGKYRIRSVAIYDYTSFRSVSVRYDTEQFTVVSPEVN